MWDIDGEVVTIGTAGERGSRRSLPAAWYDDDDDYDDQMIYSQSRIWTSECNVKIKNQRKNQNHSDYIINMFDFHMQKIYGDLRKFTVT